MSTPDIPLAIPITSRPWPTPEAAERWFKGKRYAEGVAFKYDVVE
jgi:hypothetical protein